MIETICGELIYKRKKYHFSFQDNILTMIPLKLKKYSFADFFIDEDDTTNVNININGITEKNFHICFLNVKPKKFGSGTFRCFVPAYILNKNNGLYPVPKINNIESIIFKGAPIDNFYHPKQIVNYNNNNKDITINVNLNEYTPEKFELNNETIIISSEYVVPYSRNINEVLNVSSSFEIQFKNPQKICNILKTYFKIQKFFGFLNNRKIIKWDTIILRKKVYLEDQKKYLPIDLFLYIAHDPNTKTDIENYMNSITFKDIKNNFLEIYKNVTKKDYNVYYMPLNKKENLLVDNDKFLKIAYTFESQMRVSYPDFKSSINENFYYSKNYILENINAEIKSLSTINGTKKKIKYLNQFKDIIEKSDGNLEEKILYCFKKFDNIISSKKDALLSNYHLKNLSYEALSKAFVKRRNKIAHGEFTGNFEDIDIISYILLQICIYCLILERSSVSLESIQNICNKLFYI